MASIRCFVTLSMILDVMAADLIMGLMWVSRPAVIGSRAPDHGYERRSDYLRSAKYGARPSIALQPRPWLVSDQFDH